MKRTIKSIVKLMSFGFIGLALLSCSKSETAPVQDKAVGFNTYTGRTVTKADNSLITGTTLPDQQTSTFIVYAWNTGSKSWTDQEASKLVFMNGIDVDYNGEGSAEPDNYEYSPLRYWPNDEANNKLTFFAYYPKGAFTSVPENGLGNYSFTAKQVPSEMKDLCVSAFETDKVYSNTTEGVVPFKFYHALTMVKFQIKTQEDYEANDGDTKIMLKEIQLTGVNITGTLDPTLVPSAVKPASPESYVSAWTGQAGSGTFVLTPAGISEENPFVVPFTPAVTLPSGTANTDACLMIPQDLTNNANAKITITYAVKTGSDDAVTNEATVYLKDAAVKTWKENMNIVYTLAIGLKPIKFTATVEAWDSETLVPVTVN